MNARLFVIAVAAFVSFTTLATIAVLWMIRFSEVVLVLLALGLPCIALLAIGWLGERNEAFGRFCDAVCPPDGHQGRL
jgi:uncharacterized membrane protein YoaK (UPF0700 family)